GQIHRRRNCFGAYKRRFDQYRRLVPYPARSPRSTHHADNKATNRPASVLWKPPGAQSFASRQKWERQVAYASQFMDRDARAHQGKAKINARLCSLGGFDPDQWDLPPKPKWMRWKTYNRMVEIIAKIMAPNEKVEACGLLPEAAVKALGLKP